LYGAAVAGAAAGLGGWRPAFWVNLPLGLAWAGAFVVAMRRARRPGRDTRPSGASVDWLGGVLLGGGLAILVLALYPDDPGRHAVGPLFIPLLALALLLLGAWGRHQARRPEPLIAPALLRSRVFLGANLTNLLVGVGLMVALVDVPIVARGVFGLDQLGGALLLAR